MMLVIVFFLLAFIALSIAQSKSFRLVEDLRTPPPSWFASCLPTPDYPLHLSIALNRGSHVEDALYKIATPGHSEYRRHLSQTEAQNLLNPDPDSYEEIVSWLQMTNVPSSSIVKDAHWIRFNTTVPHANTMLAAKFTWYKNSICGTEVLRTLRYSLPQGLHSKVSLVSPTTRFCSMETMKQASRQSLVHHEGLRRRFMPRDVHTSRKERRATLDPSCNRTITPICLKALYNVPSNLSLSKDRGVGVYASQNQVPKFEDFRLFVKNVAPETPNTNVTILSINNGTTSQNDTLDSASELNFDTQYTTSLSSPIPNIVFAVGGQGPIQPENGNQPGDGTEPWLQWLDAILALPDDQLPHTITTSFGEDEQSLPNGYVQQVCSQFGALGARGVSMLAASGDSGPGSACVTNDGTNRTRFTPIFPGSCPFVIAVGGVKGVNPEIATSFSAGGFSDRFARPAYQDQVVPAYLSQLGGRFEGLFNASGRGFPDVAAQSFNATFVDGGLIKGFQGTSAAAPTWAGLIGLVNSNLIAQNKAPLGFLNPWLYSTGAAGLNDIVQGGSIGCTGTNPFTGQPLPAVLGAKVVANAGWNATVGWDPVSGLGTPNIGKLLALASGNDTR